MSAFRTISLKFLVFALFMSATFARAEVQTKVIEYSDGQNTFEGYLAWDDSVETAPGILIVHQWTGMTDYEKGRARQLAAMGYVAFALDIYGKGVRPQPPEAGAEAGKYKNDRELFRKRLNLGLEQLKNVKGVDHDRLAAIGYCFGGTGVLELARSGANINGVVSFHGGLDSTNPEDGKSIKCKVLVCHGADDPFVPAADIEKFKEELNGANVDWQMIYYSGAVHSFTQPMAGDDNSRGAAYNERADHRSWAAMRQFFKELFTPE
ncbi:MAG: dienelactone hydrolase family protein [Pirellulaceae bacterium]